MLRRFAQVDVFGVSALLGNPVAVVLDADGLDDATMAALARWTNLSETTFVLPPTTDEAHYRVRIFTPAAELPFAGHPTLGTCHAWLVAARGAEEPVPAGEIVQECAAGLVRIRRLGDALAFAAPPMRRSGPVADADLARVVTALRITRQDVVDAAWVDNGPGWVAIRLADADAVLAVRPGSLGDLDVGVVGPRPPGDEEAVEVRAFFAVGEATVEDPVTGSLNAALAPWLVSTGVATFPFTARQGTTLGRHGRVHLSADPDGTIWVGGSTTTVVAGAVAVPTPSA